MEAFWGDLANPRSCALRTAHAVREFVGFPKWNVQLAVRVSRCAVLCVGPMQKLAINFAAAAIIFATFTAVPIPAFAFWIGPFHLGLALLGHRHHYHHLYMRGHAHEVARHREARHREPHGAPPHQNPNQNETATREVPQEEAVHQARHRNGWPLLYPIGPLPTMFQNILWGPASSSIWPIGYETVFSSAFAQTTTEPDQCHQPVNADAIIERLRQEIGPNTDQISRLQRLGQAIDTGADRLAKSCSTEIPHEPIARLQLMLRQIEALTMAIDLIRQPLEDFEQSLTNEQKARLAAEAASATAASRPDVNTETPACGSSSAAVDRSVQKINKSVQVSDEQRRALDELHQALSTAANDLDAQCSMPVPQSAVARLDTLEARLDAIWHAVLSIEAA
jgi:LTXXQ motif family protein